ncbi:MAG: phosphoglycerate kinase [bacterium]|nr:phosphoglycerate kinase [bacterium]
MKLKTLKDIDLRGKRVLFRVAYDVPLYEDKGHWFVADDTRIKSSIPTLKLLLKNKCKIVIVTWLGRPGGKLNEKYKLDPVAKRLEELIKKPVRKLDHCKGPAVDAIIKGMKPREIVMLENVRFNPEEEGKKASFADDLAKHGELVVFEAFAQSHRDYPSTTGLLERVPSVTGLDMEKEITTLSALLETPKHPFIVILGGAKISDKIETLHYLLPIADIILIGGAMAHNFLKAQGIKIAASFVEDTYSKKEKKDVFRIAEEILNQTKGTFVNLGPGLNIPKLVLPLDLVAAPKIEKSAETKIVEITEEGTLPWNWMYLDIGPKTLELYSKIILKSKTVFWNGPMGYFELDAFGEGTKGVAHAIAKSKALSVIGGGDTESIVKKYKLAKAFNHVSTGGGALLEFLSGKELPVMKYLKK